MLPPCNAIAPSARSATELHIFPNAKYLSTVLCAGVCAILVYGCGSDSGNEPYSLPSTPIASPTPSPLPSGALGALTPPFRGKIAFISRRNAAEREGVFVMNPDGSQVTEVPLRALSGRPLNLTIRFRGNHFMNAEGTHFVFTVLGALAGNANEGITYLINADGSDLRDITALCDPFTRNSYSTLTDGVSLNADGSRVVFSYGGFGQNESGISTRVPFSVITMRSDGSERTVRYSAASADTVITSSIFAPDGETLFFVEESEDAPRSSGTIRRLAPGASVPTSVTSITNPTGDFLFRPNISISPDGQSLVFASEADGNAEIFSVNTDGTNLTRLTSHPARDADPLITADGQKIIFGSDRDGNKELYSMNRDGSGVTRLTFEITSDEEPATRNNLQARNGGTAR